METGWKQDGKDSGWIAGSGIREALAKIQCTAPVIKTGGNYYFLIVLHSFNSQLSVKSMLAMKLKE